MSSDAIVHAITYPHPIERVWAALTDRAALAAWFMPNDFIPRLGHRFTFTVDSAEWRGTIACEVVALDPPHRLAYTWVSNHADVPPTLVTFTLLPVSGGTRLHLEHTGFAAGGPAGLTIRDILDAGWGSKLLYENLPAYLDRIASEHDGKEATEIPQTA